MIAAIYARKSNEQNSVSEEAKNVTRQVENGRAYAQSKGWLVAADHIYVDDGVSGAEFGDHRPALARLLNALQPRAPFGIVVMSEESRLGREQFETGYVLSQLTRADVRVAYYLEDRQPNLSDPTGKFMESVKNFAAEMEREKARQRTRDALLRKALAGLVTGGAVYGYRNVRTEAGVTRVVDDAEAAVVRRIFASYADGLGMITIAHRLNADGVLPPRARGWAPSGIREMLYRPLYRGEIVWNRTKKRNAAGRKQPRHRDPAEWVTVSSPDLRIIPNDLWQRVSARLEHAGRLFPRSQDSKRLLGRPRWQDESAYLLVGFARCGTCGGPVGTDLRAHGGPGGRRHVAHYACLDHKRRGAAVCGNAVGLRQDILDHAILGQITGVLSAGVLEAAVDRALAQLTAGVSEHRARHADTEGELVRVDSRLDRLLDALADGSAPREEVVAKLNAERRRKDALTAERDRLAALLRVADVDAVALKTKLQAKVRDVRAVLSRHVPQARQMLRKLLVDKITLEPLGRCRQRGYRFSGELTVDRLIEGDVFSNNTRPAVVAPTGPAPRSQFPIELEARLPLAA